MTETDEKKPEGPSLPSLGGNPPKPAETPAASIPPSDPPVETLEAPPKAPEPWSGATFSKQVLVRGYNPDTDGDIEISETFGLKDKEPDDSCYLVKDAYDQDRVVLCDAAYYRKHVKVTRK